MGVVQRESEIMKPAWNRTASMTSLACAVFFASGCISPLVITRRGVALGLFQVQSIGDGTTMQYDRLAGIGIAAWGGGVTLGYTDRAMLVIDPAGPPVEFEAPKMALGTVRRIEVCTGSIAEAHAANRAHSLSLLDSSFNPQDGDQADVFRNGRTTRDASGD